MDLHATTAFEAGKPPGTATVRLQQPRPAPTPEPLRWSGVAAR